MAWEKLLGKALSAIRDTPLASEAGLTHPASSHQFCTPTTPGGTYEISPAPPRPLAVARACSGSPLEFSTCFSDAPADHSPEVSALAPTFDPSLALSEHGPCLVGGIITFDDASFTTKIAIHSGADVLPLFGSVALLDTGSPQTFIRRDFLDRMLSVGAASIACEQKCAPRFWESFGKSAPPKTSTSVNLSAQLFQKMSLRAPSQSGLRGFPLGGAACSTAGCDGWMRFNGRSYRSLPLRPSDQRVFGELEFVHHAPTGMSVYAIDPAARMEVFRLRYEGAAGVTLPDDPQLLAVNLVRSDGSPAVPRHYLVDMMPPPELPWVEEHFVVSRRQALSLVGGG